MSGYAAGEAANLIRLATAIRYVNRHAEAEPLFRVASALTARDDAAVYRDFALQQWAKWLEETGDVTAAIACFEEALALRRGKGDQFALASTAQVLVAARELLYIAQGRLVGLLCSVPRADELRKAENAAMTLLLMLLYGLVAVVVLALMQLAMIGIVAMHRTFVARHEVAGVPVTLDGPDAPASV